jgi:hypothetical protein
MANLTEIIGALIQSGPAKSTNSRLQNALGAGGPADGNLLDSLFGGSGASGSGSGSGGLGDALSGLFGGDQGGGGIGGMLSEVLGEAGKAVAAAAAVAAALETPCPASRLSSTARGRSTPASSKPTGKSSRTRT